MRLQFQILILVLMLFVLKTKSQTRIDNFNLLQYKEQALISFEIIAGASCSGYEIQHSTDSVNFATAFNYAGVCGNTTKNQSYSFTHQTPVLNSKNYYRVLIPPADYSEIKFLEINTITGFVVYNNPVKQRFTIFININNTLELYNGNGYKIDDFKANTDGFVNADVSILAQGIYYFRVYTNNGQILNGKFLKIDQ